MVQSICHLLCAYICSKRHRDIVSSINHLLKHKSSFHTETAKRSSYPARLHQPKPYFRQFPASIHLPVPSLGLNFFSALHWEQHAWNEQRTYWLSPQWQKFVTEKSYLSDLELFEEFKLEQTPTVKPVSCQRICTCSSIPH